MKNKLTDLSDYLFEQIERINDDTLTDEELDKQIKKSEQINVLAETIIKNGELQLKAALKASEYGIINPKQMKFLLSDKKGGPQNEKEIQ